MPRGTWTLERSERVITLWNEGLSARRIADEMGDIGKTAVEVHVKKLGLRRGPPKPLVYVPKKWACPSRAIWLQAAFWAAYEGNVPLVALLAGDRSWPVCMARWRAWRAVLDRNPNYSISGIARVSGHHHATVLYGLKRLDGMPANKRERNGCGLSGRRLSVSSSPDISARI